MTSAKQDADPASVAAAKLGMTLPDLGLPPARNEFRIDDDVRVPTRDGESLLGEHYVPETDTPRGTLLVRSSYGRGFPYGPLLAEPYAERGYHVLMQSVRGTHGSTGRFEPMIHEAADAHDTLVWLREQDWFDGRLGTLGASYLGFVQYGLMMDAPEELKASVVMMAPHDFGKAAYDQGIFALETFLAWSDSTAAQAGGLTMPEMGARIATAGQRLGPAMTSLPMADAAEEALGGMAPWYREWILHPDLGDNFWAGFDFSAALGRTRAAVLLTGGWRDIFLGQMMEQYAALHDRGLDVAMTIGDWEHSAPLSVAAAPIHQQALAWFDEHLAGTAPRTRKEAVSIELVGAGTWLDLPAWPPATVGHVWYPTGEGKLHDAPTGAAAKVQFVYDPADPTPAVGGALLTGGGRVDNGVVEGRADVVTFTSEALGTDLDVVGVVEVELGVAVDNSFADAFVRLCDVDQQGRSVNMTDAIHRLDPAVPAGETQRVALGLAPCAYRIPAGHRVRLQVSGGAHPRFARNLGVAGAQCTSTDMRPSVHTIILDDSRITIPVLTQRP